MASIREFRLVPASENNRKELRLLDCVFDEALYIIDNNGPSDSAIIKDARSQKSIGTIMATTSNGQASFTITGIKDVPSSSVRLANVAKLRINHFTFTIKTPAFLEQKLEWKHTKTVPSYAMKGDAAHMKLVYAGTNNIIARFVHKPGTVHIMEGTLELHEDHGAGWDATVIMSCLAVLKYGSLVLRLKST